MSERIAQELRDAARDNVVIFVGAGVSMWTTGDGKSRPPAVASWIGLLKDGVEHVLDVLGEPEAGWAQRVRADIDSWEGPRLLAAGQAVADALGGLTGPEFLKWMKRTVGGLPVVRPQLIETLGELSQSLITTNYDNLLSDVLSERPPISWTDSRGLHKWANTETPAILHVHGHYDTPEGIVLGRQGYDAVLDDRTTQTLMAAPVLRSKGVLLVGFGAGLQDPNFGPFCQWVGQLADQVGIRAVQLVLDSEVEDTRAQAPPGISVLGYGPDFDALLPFLQRLVPERPDAAVPKQPGEATATAPVTPSSTAEQGPGDTESSGTAGTSTESPTASVAAWFSRSKMPVWLWIVDALALVFVVWLGWRCATLPEDDDGPPTTTAVTTAADVTGPPPPASTGPIPPTTGNEPSSGSSGEPATAGPSSDTGASESSGAGESTSTGDPEPPATASNTGPKPLRCSRTPLRCENDSIVRGVRQQAGLLAPDATNPDGTEPPASFKVMVDRDGSLLPGAAVPSAWKQHLRAASVPSPRCPCWVRVQAP